MFTARLNRSILLSPQTKHLELSVEGAEEFRFVPGQFVSIKHPRPDGKEHTRAYSIASAPRPNATFDLCLNRVEEGFLSNWLCDLPEGATVQFHGPHGLFTLREPRKDAVFIATGTGIAPIRGMIHWLFEEAGTQSRPRILAGLRNPLRAQHLLPRRVRAHPTGEPELPLRADAQPLRRSMDGLPRLRAGPCARNRRRSQRHASVHLRPASDGRRQSQAAQRRAGLGPQADRLRALRLKEAIGS